MPRGAIRCCSGACRKTGAHAALSAFENNGTRDFDLGKLADIDDAAFDTLDPVTWPLREGEKNGQRRFFAEGQFYTSDRKAKFVAPQPPALRDNTSEKFPLRLNTGRIRDQWHSMTRTGKSLRLATHIAEPFVEVHPEDALAYGLIDGNFARVTTEHGECILKVHISEGQRQGWLFSPIHWSDETASRARIGDLVAPHTDPYSGQPEAKATPVTIEPVELPMQGFIRSRRRVELPRRTWWTRVTTAHGVETRIATDQGLMFWHEFAHEALGRDAQLVEQVDGPSGIYRAIAFVDGEFDSCVSVGPDQSALRWDDLPAVIAAGPPRDGRAPTISLCSTAALGPDDGPLVCACFSIGQETIRQAIHDGASSVGEIAKATKAGSNCGSCLPELKQMIARSRVPSAA
ncbi:MAG TPA: molybdopterin dinucleotide binding domain-containing protein [Xanthobacteraceae bacterium]|nr:molybdopterin dinucleotide binding domain-containing protein [Xanthobacteraceae bacterium]